MRAPTLLHSRCDLIEVGDGRRLRLLDAIGSGASSTVHRALLENPSGLHRLVAVKVFGSVASEEAEEVMAHAARIATRAAGVRHPNVIEVYDFGLWRSQPYFVTELVEGVSLMTLLDHYAAKSLRLPLDLALFVACEVAEALSGARTARDHDGVQLGVLHLGLGPRKVRLGWRGEVKVGDFATSLGQAAASSIRNMRVVAHRTATLAPEVAQGQIGDSRSDVFSLGLVIRHLLVGPRFARGVSNIESARLAREGFVQPMSFRPHLPERLTQLMTRALEIDPGARHPNASAVAVELRRIALSMGVGDGRAFLRRTLDHELGNDASEITAEHPHVASAAPVPVQAHDLADLDAMPTVANLDARRLDRAAPPTASGREARDGAPSERRPPRLLDRSRRE